MVVVSFGSSPVMGAAGSTYFSVVLSVRAEKRKKISSGEKKRQGRRSENESERKKEEKRARGWMDEQTVLLLDNYPAVHIQPEDDQIGENVHPPDAVEPQRVFEGDLLRHLHHPQDHDEVGSAHI